MSDNTKNLFTSDLFRIEDFECKKNSSTHFGNQICNEYEINFIRSGCFSLQIRKRHFDIYSERILLGNAGIEYAIEQAESTASQTTVLKIEKEFLDDIKSYYRKGTNCTADLFGKDENAVFPFPVIKTSPLLACTHHLILSSLNNKTRKEFRLQTEVLLCNLIEDIFKSLYSNLPPEPDKTGLNKRHIETIELSKIFIEKNFSREISLSEIAASSFLSPFYFNRIFKKYTNLSPYSYLIQFRLKYASLLLRNTNLSVTEICYRSGFNNFSHFVSTFTKFFNTSPRFFRKSHTPLQNKK
ncbi:MAG: helix-turn-helix transcriptional regulator [Ignavibacteriales bacterium]|nr:helix-turn-helix transcriptional regulator [Ignavibacteriales bacterium]